MQDSVRIICKIEIKGPNLVKGISFEGQRVLGNPKDFIDYYINNGADEIFIQDTVASLYERSLDFDFIKNITENVNIPVIIGGGIKSIDEINAHFARRFYDVSLDEEEWWISLEKEIEGKTGLPFEQFRVNYA